jgi:predicted alpha/beta hydrolase family esterase
MRTAIQLAQLVKEMRDAQKAYFKAHTQSALTQAKALERRVDQAVDGILLNVPDVQQKALFEA